MRSAAAPRHSACIIEMNSRHHEAHDVIDGESRARTWCQFRQHLHNGQEHLIVVFDMRRKHGQQEDCTQQASHTRRPIHDLRRHWRPGGVLLHLHSITAQHQPKDEVPQVLWHFSDEVLHYGTIEDVDQRPILD